ncbi:MAG: hypothetical protein WBL85_00920, partial [Sedimentisphaerales bacterium]
MRRKIITVAVFVLLFMTASQCLAWLAEGHACATKHAIELARGNLPDFFVKGASAAVHCSGDPDVFKIPLESRQLNESESPEHFIDLEMLKGEELPNTRRQFTQLCISNKTTADKVGTVPYAVIEWTQRLTIAFAEHRKWPQNEIIQAKCLIYAGNLAHYAQDLCMPLHTTIHYDGKITYPNLPSPKTGIHLKVDALIGKVPDCNSKPDNNQNQIMPFTDLWAGIINQLKDSHSRISKVYELEADLPKFDEPIECGSSVAEFASQEYEQTSRFTAQLFLTAWNDSKNVKLPSWDHREQIDNMAKVPS